MLISIRHSAFFVFTSPSIEKKALARELGPFSKKILISRSKAIILHIGKMVFGSINGAIFQKSASFLQPKQHF